MKQPTSISKENYPNGYVLTTDSNCDLTAALLDEYRIPCISMPYSLDGEVFRRDPSIDFDPATFYHAMREGKPAKTMSCNVEEFKQFWRPYLEAGLDVVYLGFTHRLSGTFDNACMARDALKEAFPDRRIVCDDTLLICVPQGLFLLLCGKKYQSGATMDELLAFAAENRQHIATQVAVDTLEYLRRGGRISSATATFGTLLDIKPLLHISPEGALEVIGKCKGRKKALRRVVEMTMANYDPRMGDDDMMIAFGSDDDEAVTRIEEMLRQEGVRCPILRLSIGPVIGAHIGPGAAGVTYIGKQRTIEEK